MTKQTTPPKKRSSHGLSRQEMRASLLLPIGITVAIWLIGLLLVALLPTAATPAGFNTAVGIAIALSLLVFLLYWTRQANGRLRLTALLMAIPALVGITIGITNGRSRFIIGGVALTFLLLILQRFLNTPTSFRVANRYFQQGNLPDALRLINKSIAARPNFWESYQLRALIRLAQRDFPRAEEDAKQAITLQPTAHQAFNTLGQIYLAHEQYPAAQKAYEQALALMPDMALYQYHLGLSHYRQQQYRPAAENLAAATQGTLPTIRYDLQAHYYLGRSLDKLGDKKTATEAYAGMHHFQDGLATLQEQLAQQADYPHAHRLQQDAAAIARLLAKPTPNQ